MSSHANRSLESRFQSFVRGESHRPAEIAYLNREIFILLALIRIVLNADFADFKRDKIRKFGNLLRNIRLLAKFSVH